MVISLLFSTLSYCIILSTCVYSYCCIFSLFVVTLVSVILLIIVTSHQRAIVYSMVIFLYYMSLSASTSIVTVNPVNARMNAVMYAATFDSVIVSLGGEDCAEEIH